MSKESPIFVENLCRKFGTLSAVDNINLEVTAGQIFGFLGPNGAGKSTTVRMLTTLMTPTSGKARVAGYDVVTEADMVRRSIGVALQDAAIDPIMTGRELLKLQAVLHGVTRKRSKVRSEELLERVGLKGASDKRVGQYSGGMRRRLDLAMSLIHEPTVLFLDEPTTGLDPTSRSALWDEVRRLNKEFGTTVLLTTQYLEEADQLADRIAIIDGGSIVREGKPATLKEAVGDPTIRIEVGEENVEGAALALMALGPRRPSLQGRIALGLKGGGENMAAVVRALDDAGIQISHIELDPPSLEDVFAEATGRRLEGSQKGGNE